MNNDNETCTNTCTDIIRQIAELEEKLEDLKKSETNLQLLLDKYYTIFSKCSDSIFLVEPETHRILDCNDIAPVRLGFTREELLSKKFEDIEEKWEPEYIKHISKEMKEKGSFVFEHLHKHKDGRKINVEISSKAITLDNKKVYLTVVRDMTRWYETQDQIYVEAPIHAALSELFKYFVSSSTTIQEFSTQILEQSLRVTGSTAGFVSFINPETGKTQHLYSLPPTDPLYSTHDMKHNIFLKNGKHILFSNMGCQDLNRKEGYISNTPILLSVSTTLPSDHISVNRYLSVPVTLENEIVGQIGLANKDSDYTPQDLVSIEKLSRYYALAIKQLRIRMALKESEERFRYIFEQAAVGISNDSLDGKFLAVNQRFCDITGYSQEELLNLYFQKITHPDDLETDNRYASLLMNGSLQNYSREKRYIRKNGTVVWVNVTVSAMVNEKRIPQYFISIIEDISDRKRMEEELTAVHTDLESRVQERTAELLSANERLTREIIERNQIEEALRQNEAQYKRLVEGIPGILYLFSKTLGGIYYSPQTENILGYPVQYMYDHPMTWNQSIHPEDIERVNEAISNFANGEKFELEYRIKDSKGNWHWFYDRSIGTHIQEDEEVVIEGLALDITERKKTEEEHKKLQTQLREIQKREAIGTLAGGIAHDFNNILSAILGYSELAVDSIPNDNPARSMLQEILKAGTRAKDLIKQILAFSRKGDQERKPVLIHFIIKEALNLLRATIPQTIEIRHEIDPNSGSVLADPTQLHQVLMNLCTNAYHAMKDNGGSLGIKLHPVFLKQGDSIQGIDVEPGSYAKLEISDSGHGMSKAVMERIFDPYFTTKKKGEGTGLGLAVVLGIIKSHSGYITVYSEPGMGTTFRVYLPTIDDNEEKIENLTNEPIPTGGEHILFVDDEEQLVFLGREMLKKLGYKVTISTSSTEALKVFTENPKSFDIIITDMTMPEMTGAQLAAKILEIRSKMPIILCTGFSEIINEEKAKAIGFKEYILKPVIMSEMAKTIRRALLP